MGNNQATTLQEVKTENATEHHNVAQPVCRLSWTKAISSWRGPSCNCSHPEDFFQTPYKDCIFLSASFAQATFCCPLNIPTAISRTTGAVTVTRPRKTWQDRPYRACSLLYFAGTSMEPQKRNGQNQFMRTVGLFLHSLLLVAGDLQHVDSPPYLLAFGHYVILMSLPGITSSCRSCCKLGNT